MFKRFRSSKAPETNRKTTPVRKEFLNDLHRITILAAIDLLFNKRRERFTLKDIYDELHDYGIDVSPNITRNILDHLCLSNNFRLVDDTTIFTSRGDTVINELLQKTDMEDLKNVTLHSEKPIALTDNDLTISQFNYEFGVKIYPRLLVRHFGGLEQCEQERKMLISKGEWKVIIGETK